MSCQTSERYCRTCGGFHDPLDTTAACRQGAPTTTTAPPAQPESATTTASCEPGEPPPLEGEVLRWKDDDGNTFSVDASGKTRLWWGGTGTLWLDTKSDIIGASGRLAVEVVALRARVEELTALVESAYRDGHWDGRNHGSADYNWHNSDARKALLAGAERKADR